jgi:hypothetical protein
MEQSVFMNRKERALWDKRILLLGMWVRNLVEKSKERRK